MPRRDAQPGGVFQGPHRGRAEQACAARARCGDGAVDDLGDLLAAEDADDVIDLGHLVEAGRPSCARPGSRSVWYTGVSLPVIRKRGGDGCLTDVRSARGYATGR